MTYSIASLQYNTASDQKLDDREAWEQGYYCMSLNVHKQNCMEARKALVLSLIYHFH